MNSGQTLGSVPRSFGCSAWVTSAKLHRTRRATGLRGEPFASAGEAESVGRRGPDGDESGSVSSAAASVRLISSRCGASVAPRPPGRRLRSRAASLRADALPRLREQLERVGAGERGIAGGEEGADVLEAGGPEDGVRERVCEDVAVGVTCEPARWSIRTPPSTSGTSSSSACASKPVPTRYSDMRRAPPASSSKKRS
jgi:hypothetical protein